MGCLKDVFFCVVQIIVLEDKKEYMGYNTKGEIKPQEIKAQVEAEIKAQDRRPFDLLVCPSANKWRLLK